jgi:hypothetical protein
VEPKGDQGCQEIQETRIKSLSSYESLSKASSRLNVGPDILGNNNCIIGLINRLETTEGTLSALDLANDLGKRDKPEARSIRTTKINLPHSRVRKVSLLTTESSIEEIIMFVTKTTNTTRN